MDELEYWFDGNKITGTDKEGVIREKFKALLFDENTNRLTSKGEEVFISMTVSLRQNILGMNNADDINAFEQLAGNIQSKLYQFVYVK